MRANQKNVLTVVQKRHRAVFSHGFYYHGIQALTPHQQLGAVSRKRLPHMLEILTEPSYF